MADENLELLLKHPLITKYEQDSKQIYRGTLMLSNFKDIEIEIVHHLNGEFQLIQPELQLDATQSTTIADFIDSLKLTMEKQAENQSDRRNLTPIYRKVLYDLNETSKFYLNIKLSSIAPDLSVIHMETVDDAGRLHKLKIQIDFNCEQNLYTPIDVDLPERCVLELRKFSNLAEICSQFLAQIDLLQPFFNRMHEIDVTCWVLDPEPVHFAHCYRRIALGENVSMQLTIDPSHVSTRPDMVFLGAERVVCDFRRKLNRNLDKWREDEGSFMANLLEVLELTMFPQRKSGQSDGDDLLMGSGDCCICFAHRFNDKLPEIVCGNESCANCYHIECLYEWLTSVNSKRIFNQVHGQCPNCELAISCPLPKLKENKSGIN